MTHKDADHYAAKHSKETKLNSEIAAAIKPKLSNNSITCAAAHKIATDLTVRPLEVGRTIDLLEKKLSKCQLGLFGYKPHKKPVKAASTVSVDLANQIRTSSENQHISCLNCWQIAQEQSYTKMDVAAACDSLKIRICDCQLGAF